MILYVSMATKKIFIHHKDLGLKKWDEILLLVLEDVSSTIWKTLLIQRKEGTKMFNHPIRGRRSLMDIVMLKVTFSCQQVMWLTLLISRGG